MGYTNVHVYFTSQDGVKRELFTDRSQISATSGVLDIQGGPAKVRPTYIFDGNI